MRCALLLVRLVSIYPSDRLIMGPRNALPHEAAIKPVCSNTTDFSLLAMLWRLNSDALGLAKASQ